MNNTKKYIRFHQNSDFVIRAKEECPVLSEKALIELGLAKANASYHYDWRLLDWQIKTAMIQRNLLKRVLRAESPDESKERDFAREQVEYVWEAIRFVEKWVVDIYPFRDHSPED